MMVGLQALLTLPVIYFELQGLHEGSLCGADAVTEEQAGSSP